MYGLYEEHERILQVLQGIATGFGLWVLGVDCSV